MKTLYGDHNGQIWMTGGGSHRANPKALRALDAAGIPYKYHGSIHIDSKKVGIGVAPADVEKAKAVGFVVDRAYQKIFKDKP